MMLRGTRDFLAGSALLALVIGSLPASGQTLTEALSQAYATNPQLNSQRTQVKVVDERLPQAQAGWRPTATVTTGVGASRVWNQQVTPNPTDLTPKTAQLQVVQPIYRGGRTENGVERAKNEIKAARARLLATEQTILLQTATSYLNVIRDAAVVTLNENNEKVLRQQLQATRDRFEVGEVTRTDVSQAEARLAGIIADKEAALGQLRSSRATFVKLTGFDLNQTSVPASIDALLPKTDAEARSMAEGNNPEVTAAIFDEAAARASVDETRGELLPTLSLVGAVNYSSETQPRSAETKSASITAQLSVPLYEAGSVYSRIRQAKQTASQRRIDQEQTRRIVAEAAVQAFQTLVSARAQIVSLNEQIRAAQIALDGVKQEAAVGSRTTLDVLNQEQELLNSQVTLVRAQRDEASAAYQLLAATGQLTAQKLQLPVQIYDYEANYNHVDGRWIGTETYDEKNPPAKP